MAVPTYDQFIEPMLRFLASQSAPGRAKKVREASASAFGLAPGPLLAAGGECACLEENR